MYFKKTNLLLNVFIQKENILGSISIRCLVPDTSYTYVRPELLCRQLAENNAIINGAAASKFAGSHFLSLKTQRNVFDKSSICFKKGKYRRNMERLFSKTVPNVVLYS